MCSDVVSLRCLWILSNLKSKANFVGFYKSELIVQSTQNWRTVCRTFLSFNLASLRWLNRCASTHFQGSLLNVSGFCFLFFFFLEFFHSSKQCEWKNWQTQKEINIVPERSVKCFALTSGLDVFFCVCVSVFVPQVSVSWEALLTFTLCFSF